MGLQVGGYKKNLKEECKITILRDMARAYELTRRGGEVKIELFGYVLCS